MRLQTTFKRNMLSAATTLSVISAFGLGATTTETPIAYSQTTVRELPLPAIPATLRHPGERAEYLLMHFWDAMDFADTTASRDREFMEQNFANFASVFPHADTTAVIAAIGRMLTRAESDKPAYLLLSEIAEKYLYQPDSPLCDDNHYIIFLEGMLRSPILDEYEKIRPEYQLNTARKNRVGSTAADFVYVGRDGHEQTLRNTKGDMILLLFYDPDCEHCMEIMASLGDDAMIRSTVNDGSLTVLAVFADGDHETWIRKPNAVPDEWADALDTTGVQEHELYSFKQLPAIYLLDKDKRVLLKECDTATLVQSLVQCR